MMPHTPRRILLGLWGIILVAAVCWPFALSGEFLWRDMVLLNNPGLTPSALGAGSLPARNAPQDGFLALLGGAWAARVLIFAAAGAAALTAALWSRTTVAALAAMTIAVANPFVIERLLQGQWSLAIAAWLLPVIAWAGRRHSWLAWLAMWGASLTPTGGLFAVVTALFTCRKRVALAGCLLWLPWLVPGLFQPGVPGDAAAAVAAFSPRAEEHVGTVGALLRLGGIWNGEAALGMALFGLFVAVLALAGAHRVPARLTVLAALGIGGALACWLLPGLLEWAIDNVPGSGLLRDSHKLTMLALPLYVASIGALPQIPAALALVAATIQVLPAPSRLAVLSPAIRGWMSSWCAISTDAWRSFRSGPIWWRFPHRMAAHMEKPPRESRSIPIPRPCRWWNPASSAWTVTSSIKPRRSTARRCAPGRTAIWRALRILGWASW